ncbi:tetratricopeptide repeat protein 28 [Biomphalaria glabrata]|nr:tetratricopeptide repeat protein 28 [Biomphalaria glabrata]
MEKYAILNTSLLRTLSLPSLAEGNETISEVEEINEVKSLREQGIHAAKTSDFDEAVQFYTEALEIDSENLSVLQARALAYLEQGKNAEALADAESILALDSENAKGCLLQGIAYKRLNMLKASLDALLCALDLDPNNADKISDHLASTVVRMCQTTVRLDENFLAMNAYEKLCELGVILYQNKKYEAAISVLDAARKIQTNQKGITLRVLLTLANAHSQLMHVDTAISLFQETWGLALANHDHAYQTKCLVNIATLHLSNGDTHMAIIFYEKLLHLEAELAEESGHQGSLPDYWTKELQCGLHLNLSIAYKAVGNLASAVVHAKKYMRLAETLNLETRMVADSHHNVGVLNEIIGNYQEAIQSYNVFLQKSQATCNQKSIGQAYGCLASVHAALKKYSLALGFHKQHLAIATELKDRKMMAVAHEMFADTLCLMEDFNQALEHYTQVLSLCRNVDNSSVARAQCKMAAAYKNMGQTQYSLYYCKEALSLAERFGFTDLEILAEYYKACILKDSSQFLETDEAQKIFMKLIPYLEEKISKHIEEDSLCPEVYEEQLSQCYDGMQTILSAMSNKLACLQYAEAQRKRRVISLPNFQSTCRAGNHSLDLMLEVWGTDHMNRIVSFQNATVLYYSLLDNILLLWVLSPGQGVTRFYSTKGSSQNLTKKITDLLQDIKSGWNTAELLTTSESRALPSKLPDKYFVQVKKLCDDDENLSSKKRGRPALMLLYELLINPVSDILDKLEVGSHLVIIPDKQLKWCPFGALTDHENKSLSDRFHISYVPCLMLLDRVVQNELSSLSLQDELETQRRLARLGGVVKYCMESSGETPSQYDTSTEESEAETKINLREVSNPRLLAHRPQSSAGLKLTSKSDSNQISLPGHTSKKSGTNQNNSDPSFVTLPGQKLLAVHTYTTLCSDTWTHTDIISSTHDVTSYKQISDQRNALVFGCPNVHPSIRLHNKEWKPKSHLEKADAELSLVAGCLGTDKVVGDNSTRHELLSRLETAELVHIATWACLQEGWLLVTPDVIKEDSDDSSHLVTVTDILSLKLRAKLVVLSTSGLSAARTDQECPMKLANAFLSAGATSVLVCMWPISDDMLHTFFFHFYFTLQKSAFISEALSNGVKAIREHKRRGHVCHWAGFKLIGKDTKISLSEIRHAELDQLIDSCERQVEEESVQPVLNLPEDVPTVPTKEENIELLQRQVKSLLQDCYKRPQVIPCLIDLMDAALKRLHTPENNSQLCVLNNELASDTKALELLKWLGFHFQPKGTQLTEPYVVFPHWNTDKLLIPTYDVLRAAKELSSSSSCVTALCETLPLSQDNISNLIDLLCITKHAPEIQLKVTDLTVQPLWHNPRTKSLLTSTGYHQVGLLLTFNMTPDHKELLVAMLQFLLAFSCYKSPVLLFKLDVKLLGRNSEIKDSSNDCPKLPTLMPLLLPRNKLKMSTPWLSVVEQKDEMPEKMKLAKSLTNLNEEYQGHMEKAKTWHQISLAAQSKAAKERPVTTPKHKVKVKAGASPSQQRVPVDFEKELTPRTINQRREYSHFILQERLAQVNQRKKDGLIKLYLPYIHS